MTLQRELEKLDVALDLLRTKYPDHYRVWVGVGVHVGLAAYLGTSASQFIEHGCAAMQTTDPYVGLVMMVSALFWWRKRTHPAAQLSVLAAVGDVLISVALGGLMRGSPTAAIPPLLVAVGLWLGGRAVLFVGASCALLLPFAVGLGQALGLHAGFEVEGARLKLVAAEAALLATIVPLLVFLWAFAQTLLVSQNAERRQRELQDQLLHAQKLEALGLLAGGIAHDFNNLLTAVAGYGSLLSSSSDPEARELSGGIMAAQERGTALIRPLLAFARQELVEPKPIDLSSTLTGMVTILRRLLGERTQLDLEANEACPIVADAGQVEQVVINLVANARDAMPSGGTLFIGCHAWSQTVALTVEDSGEGMSEETLGRIFEPFFTTKSRGKGTGLGLSTVHGLVTSSGGTISVESKLGYGTTFTLTWPRTEQSVDDEVSQVSPRANSDQPRTILVAEDNDSVRAIVKRVLERAGYFVLLARSGEEALELLLTKEQHVDLLLSDVIMPGITGPELLEQVQATHPELPYLFMSGYLGEIADRYDFDPELDLITKPFAPLDLLERLETRLR